MPQARDIVLIGASRGAIETLCSLLEHFSTDFPAAILIALHTSPTFPRLLVDAVGRRTALMVAFGREGAAIERGRVYIAPPRHYMVIVPPGVLHLVRFTASEDAPGVVDTLFQSAAEVYGARTVGVVLTGNSDDGTLGLRAITEAGGVRVVQEPVEALSPSMPLNAVVGDHPNYRLKIAEIGSLLNELARGIPPKEPSLRPI
jgi:two-component system chemotaxis response regulator CheB